MAHFHYTAEKNEGEVYKGVAEAADRFELYSMVRREGGHIISVNEERAGGWLSLAHWNETFSTITEYDTILFSRNLGAMLAAGLPLARALAVLQRQTRNPRLGATIADITRDVRRGDSLHVALGKYPRIFSRLCIALVRSGEESGDLSGALAAVSDQTERMYTLKKKIRGAMLYPCIILIAIFGIGILMMIEVVPTLAATFDEMGAELPASTTFVIGLSDVLVNNTFVVAGFLLLAVSALWGALRTARGQRVADYVFLRMPVIGEIVKEVNAARTSRTLSSLLSSGVDVLTAIEITSEVVQNSYCREVLKNAGENVGAGEPLSSAFLRREELYPAFVGEMMAVGEETGQTPEMLKRLASYYEDEVDRKTKDMSTIIEPFLMIIIGAAVGFFAISMITPIYSLSQNI